MYYSNKVGGYSILATAFMVYNKHHPLVVSTPISCTPNHTVTTYTKNVLYIVHCWNYILYMAMKRLWWFPYYTVVTGTPSTSLSSWLYRHNVIKENNAANMKDGINCDHKLYTFQVLVYLLPSWVKAVCLVVSPWPTSRVTGVISTSYGV